MDRIKLNTLLNSRKDEGIYEAINYMKKNMLVELEKEISKINSLQLFCLENNLLDLIIKFKKLDLSNLDLEYLPESICELQNLEEIELSKNNLKLPECFKKLSHLKKLAWLDLGENNIDRLPVEVNELVQLEGITLDRNKMSDFPKELCNLNNLKLLHLSNNNLKGDIQGIDCLDNLNYLSLANNPEINFPILFLRLINLKKLIFLDIGNNNLSSLPNEFFLLKNLKKIRLWGNNFPEDQKGIIEKMFNRTFFPLNLLFKSKIEWD